MRRLLFVCSLLVTALLAVPRGVAAQGTTTGALSGTVTDPTGRPVAGATVGALHQPSGTGYRAVTRADGRYLIPNMRVGGPYQVSVSQAGFAPRTVTVAAVALGTATNLDVQLQQTAVAIEGITVTGERGALISSDRTGAATNVSREQIATLPTITGQLSSVARLTPQSGGGMSFAGQDPRLNNITVDGSYFRSSFGLGNNPGERTGVAPISLSAIEAFQVNIAPFDVRQGNFVGAAVNTVTRSGTNEFRGSLGYEFRDQGLVGTSVGPKSANLTYNPGTFRVSNLGGWVSGPIIKNKLFYFVNYEDEGRREPGTNIVANTGNQTAGGNISRVKASDLDALANFLSTRFNYNPGVYQGYNAETPARRFLGKLDYNITDRHKLSLRYNQLDSETDVPVSNSSSLGFGNRRGDPQRGINFQASNYTILENIRSGVVELNSSIGTGWANNLIAGYTYQDESRGAPSTLFPFVDVLEGGAVYTSFGTEPFTPNNELRYGTFQFQDNLSRFFEQHTLTFGVTAERYHSENVFFPGSQSVYTYNSLADFYADANDYLAKCTDPNSATCLNRTSPVQLRRFQVRWANIPGMEKPTQPLTVFTTGAYVQDEWQPLDRLKVTAGLRLDRSSFANTAFANAVADTMSFLDENGTRVKYSSGKLPDASILWSPRLGVNLDVFGNHNTQLRGGTGVFTGPPAYVWISNQIGNTGVLTGFEEINNTRLRPFNPDPNRYKPTTVTGAPASSFELALTDANYKFPQIWRSDIALDQRLPFGFVGTVEYLYNRDVNGTYYINANLTPANSKFQSVNGGGDQRPRWTGNNRIYNAVQNAIVLKNQDVGRSWNFATSLERAFRGGFFLKGAYSYGESKNTVDPGSIAFGSWNGNPHAGDPNNPGLGYAAASPGHRAFLTGSFRREYFKAGATTLSFFAESRSQGNTSYTYSGDLNGDGGTANDLIYIPRDRSEMNFQPFTVGSGASARTYTAAQQADAWEAFIQQDPYLSKHRGEYAQRGAVFLPNVFRVDLGFTQDLFTRIGGRRNGLQFRADILNFGNLLNQEWGTGQRLVTTQPLVVPSTAQGGPADAQGRAQYRLRTVGANNDLITRSLETTAGSSISDVYQVRLSFRYTFNDPFGR